MISFEEENEDLLGSHKSPYFWEEPDPWYALALRHVPPSLHRPLPSIPLPSPPSNHTLASPPALRRRLTHTTTLITALNTARASRHTPRLARCSLGRPCCPARPLALTPFRTVRFLTLASLILSSTSCDTGTISYETLYMKIAYLPIPRRGTPS